MPCLLTFGQHGCSLVDRELLEATNASSALSSDGVDLARLYHELAYCNLSAEASSADASFAAFRQQVWPRRETIRGSDV